MDTDSSALEQLSRDECMRLMGSVPVGRIVYTRQALPAVSVDLAEHTGWSVTIVGRARAVADGAEIRRLERAAPPSWVTRRSGHFVRISPSMVNGRRVAPMPVPPSCDHPLVSSQHAGAGARRLGPKGPPGCDLRP
jgi:uncharacterized protein